MDMPIGGQTTSGSASPDMRAQLQQQVASMQQQEPPMESMGTQGPVVPPEEDFSDINKTITSTNLVPALLKKKTGLETLETIAQRVVQGYEKDLLSRKDWEEMNKEYMKLACQIMEEKNYPWPKASNVKFPILTTAALQFASRAYPALVSGFDVVKAKAIGNDSEGKYNAVAQTISTHMSYQLLYEMPDWDEDMDKLCFILPITGTVFKKTYYDPHKGTNCSELILARDLVVDYWAKNLDSAYRKTHRIYRTPNEIISRQRANIYVNDEEYLKDAGLDRGGSIDIESKTEQGVSQGKAPDPDEASPRMLLEQHTFFDLDDDGYEEPYVITLDYESKKILRIVARFYKEGVEIEDDKIIKIVPCEYFTKFGFLPNPDGGFYDLGFGLLLGGVNGAVNTLINQLIDAGTLANIQGGFISKGIRVKQGDMKLSPGQWITVNNFGDDLKKGIFPLPVKEPSNVLFQLLGTLAQSGKELASIAEIFTGKMPGQNTPASTTMATIEQGLKVFTAIYKRIYRSLGEEFEKLYALNKLYLPEKVSFNVEVAGEDKHITVKKSDYQLPTQAEQGQAFVRIVPAADPNMVSETQKLVKAQGLLELIQLGTINPAEATKQILEQQGQANIKQLMTMPPPQPNPEVEMKQKELEMKMQIEQQKIQADIQKMEMEMEKLQLELEIEKQKAELELKIKQLELQMKVQEHQMDMKFKQEEQNLELQTKEIEADVEMRLSREMADHEMAAAKEKHNMQMTQMKEKSKQQPKKGE